MKEFLSIREVAEYLDVDYKTIYRLVQAGEMPAGKVGGVYRLRRQDVEAYFARQQQALAQEAAETQEAERVKCGRCLRLLLPDSAAGFCSMADCDEPLCPTCWQDDPDHRCRRHVLSPEARLRQARAQLAQGEVPLLLTSEAAHRREFLYLSRVEAKLRELDRFPHPLNGSSVRVPDWGAIESREQGLEHFREAAAGFLDQARTSFLPTNPRYTYKLSRGLLLEIVVYSDLGAHLKQGFVTQPTSLTELFEMLSQAIRRAEAENSLIVLGIAATTGWEQEAITLVVGGEDGQRPFHHRLVAPVLVDLAGDHLIWNRTDTRLDRLAPLLSSEMDMDVVQGLMDAVERLFRTGRTGVLQSEMVERGRAPVEAVAAAFDRLAASGDYEVKELDKAERMISLRSV